MINREELRDKIAAEAMSAIIRGCVFIDVDKLSKQSYEIADAMLKARDTTESK
jgi:hypothetical protein